MVAPNPRRFGVAAATELDPETTSLQSLRDQLEAIRQGQAEGNPGQDTVLGKVQESLGFDPQESAKTIAEAEARGVETPLAAGLAQNFAKGVLEGPGKIAAFIVDELTIPGIIAKYGFGVPLGAKEGVEQAISILDQAAGDKDFADFAEFAGKLVPELLVLGGIMSLSEKTLLFMAPKLVPQLAKQIAKVSADKELANLGLLTALPVATRLTQASARAPGFGAFAALTTAAEEGDADEVISSFVKGTMFGFGVESAFIGLTQLSPRGRSVDVRLLKDIPKEATKGKVIKSTDDVIVSLLDEGDKLLVKLAKFGAQSVDTEVVAASRELSVVDRRASIVQSIKAYKKIAEREFLDEGALNLNKLRSVRSAERGIKKVQRALTATDEFIAQNPFKLRALSDRPWNADRLIEDAELYGRDLTKKGEVRVVNALEAKNFPELALGHIEVQLGDATNLASRTFVRRTFEFYNNHLKMWKLDKLQGAEGLARRLGIAGLKVLATQERVGLQINIRQLQLAQSLEEGTIRLRDAAERAGLGRSNKLRGDGMRKLTPDQREGNAYLAPVLEIWESVPGHKRALEAIEAKFGPQVAKFWDKFFATPLAKNGRRLEDKGIVSLVGALEKQELEIGNYFPQTLNDEIIRKGTTNAMIKKIMSNLGVRRAEAEDILNSAGYKGEGLRKFGNLDVNRSRKGTTFKKNNGRVGRGTVFESDPFRALQKYMQGAIIREETGGAWGFNGELGEATKRLIQAGGAGEAEANFLMDTILFNRATQRAHAALFNVLGNIQTISKLTFAVVPNLFQPVNDPLVFGVKSSFKGLGKRLSGVDRAKMMEGIGMLDSQLQSEAHLYQGNRVLTLSDRMAQRSLKITGFSPIEVGNRIGTGHTAVDSLLTDVEMMANGAIRGDNVGVVRRRLAAMGMDYDELMARRSGGKIFVKGKEIAGVQDRAIRLTQFTSDQLALPPFWRTPKGRVITQFKSFAFNQGKLIFDRVIREAGAGNFRPMAYYFSLYPLAGELIADTISVLKDKPRSRATLPFVGRVSIDSFGPWRILNNITYVGGLGLMWNAYNAVAFGRPFDLVAGPIISDARSVVETLGAKDTPKALGDFLENQPIVQGLITGARFMNLAASVLDDGIDLGGDSAGPSVAPGKLTSLDDLRAAMSSKPITGGKL